MLPNAFPPLRKVGFLVLVAASFLFASCQGDKTEVWYSLDEQVRWSEQASEAAAALVQVTGSDPRRAAGLLGLPAETPVEFFLRIPAGSELSVDEITSGDPGAWVEVEMRLAGDAGQAKSMRANVTSRRQKLPLRPAVTMGEDEIVRLTVTARSTREPVVVRGAVVRVPAGPDSSVAEFPLTEDSESPPPNVILVVIDTLRADHLGIYGHDRAVSPQIDAFARQAVLFRDAVAQSTWTRPAVASIFTGLEPHLHQLNEYGSYLSEENLTLAEILTERQYSARGTIANSIIQKHTGFAQGFEEFTYRIGKADAHSLFDHALDLVGRLERSPPFLLYVHAMDPHIPYDPPRAMAARFASGVSLGPKVDVDAFRRLQAAGAKANDKEVADLRRIYDAEIAGMDEQLGRFLERLRELGLYDDALIVVTVDHGEEFWERGRWGHGYTLNSETMQVPLVVKPPGATYLGREVTEIVSQVDIFRTVADYAGIDVPDYIGGRTLRPLIESRTESRGPDHGVFSKLGKGDYSGVSVTTSRWKLIVPRSKLLGSGPQLFDRVADPREREDLASRRPIVLGYLSTLLRRHESRRLGWIHSASKELSKSDRADLIALGYLDPS